MPISSSELGSGTPFSRAQMPPAPIRANPGLIGGFGDFLFGPREARTEHIMQDQQLRFKVEREQREAQAAARVTQEIATRVQQGMTPQGALVDFIKSPQGADLFAQDAGALMKGVQNFVASISPESKVVPAGATLAKQDPVKGTTTQEFTAPNFVQFPIFDQYQQQIGSGIMDTTTGRVVQSTHPDRVPIGGPAPQQGNAPQSSTTTPPQAGEAPAALDINRAKAAIRAIETPGHASPYEAVGKPNKKGQRAYGAYQVMDFNVPHWTKEATGVSLTPQQFLKNPEAQEKVFEHFFTKAFEQTGSATQAASIWFTGKANAPLAQDVNGMTGQRYTQRFDQVYGQQQPGQPGAVQPTQQPGQGTPGTRGTPGQPYIPRRVIADPGATPETGFKPLWNQIPNSTGIIPGILSGVQRITGQFGADALPKEVSQARIAFRDATNGLIRATALNPRFIGAEQQRIRETFSFEPGFFTDERTLADRLIYMDDNAAQWIGQLNREWRDPKTPMERRKEIANAKMAFEQFRERLGVPPVGSPERENPPRSTFRQQLDMSKGAVGAVKKGAGAAKRDATGASPGDLGSMSVDEVLKQPNLTPAQRKRYEALKGAQ